MMTTRTKNALAQLCLAAGAKNPGALARQLMILVQGTIVYGQSQRDPAIASAAKETAAMLLDQAVPRGGRKSKRLDNLDSGLI